jgi:hypothetical protein
MPMWHLPRHCININKVSSLLVRSSFWQVWFWVWFPDLQFFLIFSPQYYTSNCFRKLTYNITEIISLLINHYKSNITGSANSSSEVRTTPRLIVGSRWRCVPLQSFSTCILHACPSRMGADDVDGGCWGARVVRMAAATRSRWSWSEEDIRGMPDLTWGGSQEHTYMLWSGEMKVAGDSGARNLGQEDHPLGFTGIGGGGGGRGVSLSARVAW